VRSRRARSAFAIGSAGLVVLAIAGCQQQQSEPAEGGTAQADLKIVEQVQIDENGAEVAPPEAAAAADPAGNGQAQCPPLSIAMAGALTGPDAALGINIKNGIQLAVDKHNAANPGCQVQLKTFDTEGDPQKATQIAPQIINDAFTIGLIGPAFSGETNATGDVFNQAGLVAATASATNVTLSEKGWKTFFRGLANDGVQGPSVANYLKNTLGYDKVCVVDDSTDYGLGLAQAIRETLGPVADSSCNISVKKGDKDFSAAVTQIKGASPKAVFFSGYYSEAAPLAQQLKDGGFEGTFVSGDGTKDPEFVKQAGSSAKDALLSCPCGPATGSFADEYNKKFNQEPSTYSTEGYDLGTIMVKGIDSGAITRPALLEYVRTYNGPGISRNYQWTPTGELTSSLIWIYKVQ
jgi:branched-chain amino acid transport system substrate-binding protein